MIVAIVASTTKSDLKHYPDVIHILTESRAHLTALGLPLSLAVLAGYNDAATVLLVSWPMKCDTAAGGGASMW